MSVRIMSMVFDSRALDSTQKLIMLALADYANDEGKSIYPSQDTLSVKTGLARETINRRVKELIELGYLVGVGYKRNKSGVLELEIVVNKLRETESHVSAEGCDGESQGVLPKITGGVTESHRGCDGESHKPSINHQLTIKESKQGESDDSPERDTLLEESKAKTEEYLKRIRENNPFPFLPPKDRLGMVLNNINDYPADVQDTIKSFCKRWKIPPPPRSSKVYAKWIRDGRELLKISKNAHFSVDEILDETYYIWKTPPPNMDIPRKLFEGRFTVKDIGSVNNMAWVATSNLLNEETKRKTKIYYDADGNMVERD